MGVIEEALDGDGSTCCMSILRKVTRKNPRSLVSLRALQKCVICK